MTDPGRTIIAVAALLAAAAPSVARSGDEFGEDLLSPGERKKLEMKRKRAAKPVLRCVPSRVRAKVRRGQTVTVRLAVQNGGGRTLSWSIRWAPEWVGIDVRGGDLKYRQKRTVVLVVDPGSLPDGETRDRIVIEAAGADGSPLAIPVLVDVSTPGKPKPSSARRPAFPGPSGGADVEAGDPRGAGRIGMRAGYVDFGGGSEATALVGFYLGWPGTGRFDYELGLDIAQPEAADGTFSSMLFAGRVDLLFPVGEEEASTRPYLLSGLEGFVEQARDGAESYANFAGALSLGAGVDLGGGMFDLRATYSLPIGSDNSTGITLVSAAVGF